MPKKVNGKARKGRGAGQSLKVNDYRHEQAKRKNIPPAKIAAEGNVPILPKTQYSYSPRRPPVLRFDPDGGPDKLPELLDEATRRPLTSKEARLVADALRNHDPWLEWAGKRESQAMGFTVDPLALHIHERVSAQAILKVAAREDVQRSLFADPQQSYQEAVRFYQYDIDWANRLILGDSLQVMSSLAKREDLAGKVQMIYMDPPYGIKFASNFQSEIGKREVKDKEADLTREPETIKAYRDTWRLGVHSYLSYLRDRLVVAKQLLVGTGSIFVQIGEENLHTVRDVMDEVFGSSNFLGMIAFVTTGGQSAERLGNVFDFLLWYGANGQITKYRQLYTAKGIREGGGWAHSRCEFEGGWRENVGVEKVKEMILVGEKIRPYSLDGTASQGVTTDSEPVVFQGRTFPLPPNSHWKTNATGRNRLSHVERFEASENSIRYVRFIDDFPVQPVTNIWEDTNRPGYIDAKRYVVQTSGKVIERCVLMTTDPGDLVLDPTCGSGTTAYVAEEWGRRWITTDTSRVSIAIARQRLLTSRYEYFSLRDETEGVGSGFNYRKVPHVTLRSIAQNTNLDPIIGKHEGNLDVALATCNTALAKTSAETRNALEAKLRTKERQEGRRSITDADRRRWKLPQKWKHWDLPFDTDPDYRKELAGAVTEYRRAWRAKMDEVNACIAANAQMEELVDQPEKVSGIVRVSGPFTVEAVQPPELSLGDPVGFDGEPDEIEGTFEVRFVENREQTEARNIDAYLDNMLRLIKLDGVGFPDNKRKSFTRLEPLTGTDSGLHAEGRWVASGETDADLDGPANACVAFGPQYGPVTAKQVEELVRVASRRYSDLVIAAFSFDGPAQTVIAEAQHPKLRIHMAHIRPDVNPAMNGLLKDQPGSQLFTVFGEPTTKLEGPDQVGMFTLTMEGVMIYNPVDNSITRTGAEKVAAWFMDTDYDGRTFCITQAFFPDRSAWEKLSKALDGVLDPDRFAAFSGTVSLPFASGKYRCVAVKVIDPRGNEVMRVHKLGAVRA